MPDIGAVQGDVTLDGSPVPGALVVFSPEKGRPSEGVTDEAGHYQLTYSQTVQGAIIGSHQVTISTGRPASLSEGVEVEPAVKETLPTKYNTGSELSAQVDAGENQIDFKLQSK